MRTYYDLSIVGAGIVGIAHALAAASLGLRVVVLDRDRRAVGASVRNFGLVTVTGQQRGLCHRRALRSRDIGDAVGPLADIPIVHRGLVLAAFRDESMDVIDAFVADAEMGAGCSDLTRQTALAAHPELNPERLLGALWSPHERRVDPRYAVARLARWLARSHDVDFLFGVAVHGAAAPRVETSIGPIRADRVVVCPGSDFTGLWSDRIAALGLTKCKLHMLRLAQPAPDWRLSAGIMNDTSVVRYLGYAELPPAETVGAAPALVLAAYLHDIGHLLDAGTEQARIGGWDLAHEDIGADWLAVRFANGLADPVAEHVAAKRYLCRVDAGYRQALSRASERSLQIQGGPMIDEEIARFEALPVFGTAVALRRWDDRAKQPHLQPWPLAAFLAWCDVEVC